jgi:mannitol/fructose-specific phosphotransferase system IIA component (Ntr-type)
MQTQAKDYWKLFKASACSLKLKGTTQEEVFQEIATNLVRAKLLPSALEKPAVKAFMAREELATTGVGQNVAIPHVKLKGLEEPIFSLSLHPEGMEWRSVDGEPVKILFAVLRPERAGARFDPDRHLDMMKWISKLVRQADFRRFSQAVSKRTELVDLLKEMSQR